MSRASASSPTIPRWRHALDVRRAALREDAGQALALVLILVLLIAILVPVIATSVDYANVATSGIVNSERALSAAESGIQDYRNYLNNYTGYTSYNYGGPAPSGEGSAAFTGWEQVGTTDEYFHWVPDASRLGATSGNSRNLMLVEVTGRSGRPGAYSYRSILASYQLKGILIDSYFSEYELNDPNAQNPSNLPTITVQPPSGPALTNQSMASWNVTYSYTNAQGNSQTVGPEPLSTALCLYHTYEPNTFLEALGNFQNPWANGGTKDVSAANPYYGPDYESTAITYTDSTTGDTFTIPGLGSTTAGQCDQNGLGIYNNTVTFGGTAYTNDQLWLCGNPTFTGSPPLVSGAPANLIYADNWMGAGSKVVGGKTVYFPLGYQSDFHDGCGGSHPVYGPGATPKAPQTGGTSQLPSTTASLIQYADGAKNIPGCLYTGPTMIEFVKGGTMNVWSPLTQNTAPALNGGAATSCGSFSPSNPWQVGVAVPAGVIYVQSEQASATGCSTADGLAQNQSPSNCGYASGAPPISTGAACTTPAADVAINTCYHGSGVGKALPTGATCIDPYASSFPANSSQCEQGDVMLEGELRGKVTVATSSNIIATNNITYQCVDGTGGASDSNPSSVSACSTSSGNDILGLISQNEFIVAHPTSGGGNASTCTTDGTGSTQTLSMVVPWSCDTSDSSLAGGAGIVIDGAAVTLNGSTYVPQWNVGAGLGTLYQDGTNINYFPGFNGVVGGAGYTQNLNYDTRLDYLSPPDLLAATDTVWQVSSFVICGEINTQTLPTVPATGGQALNCPTLP